MKAVAVTPLRPRDRWMSEAEALARTLPCSRDGSFPAESFEMLRRGGLLTASLPDDFGGSSLGTVMGSTDSLLRVLAAIGRADLAVGRIYEGHVNALQLILTYGTPDQIRASARDARKGHLSGIWNTDAPETPVTIRPVARGRWRLAGSKVFCSGAGHIARPVITARNADGAAQMCIIPAEEVPLHVDLSGWRPLGMEASVSGRVGFDGIEIGDAALLGQPGSYARDPWFRGGAIRFCAVQLGGAEALLDVAIHHLRDSSRAEDVMQIARIGQCAVAIEGGRAWLARSAGIFDKAFAGDDSSVTAEIVQQANMTRIAIERIGLDVMELVTRSIGLAGLLRPHPLEQMLRDLTTYLRQPAPDAALLSVGRALLGQNSAQSARNA